MTFSEADRNARNDETHCRCAPKNDEATLVKKMKKRQQLRNYHYLCG